MSAGEKKFTRGFSLVELMVVIAVAAILMSVAIPNMVDFSQNNKLQAKNDEIISLLGYARAQALVNKDNYTLHVVDGHLEVKNINLDEPDRKTNLEENDIKYKVVAGSIESFVYSKNGSANSELKIRICNKVGSYEIEIKKSGIIKSSKSDKAVCV